MKKETDSRRIPIKIIYLNNTILKSKKFKKEIEPFVVLLGMDQLSSLIMYLFIKSGSK
jgi:hypothetical protein